MSRIVIFLLGFFLSLHANAIQLKPVLDGGATIRFGKYLDLAVKAERIVNKPEFKAAILAKKFTSTKLTGQQIWDKMEAGSELLIPEANGIWDWKVGFYTKNTSKVIGWTNGSIITVWVNTKYFDKNDEGDIIANIVHEYLHKIGLDHSSAKDYNSAPYWIGYLARDLYNKSLTEVVVELPPVIVTPEPEKPVVKAPVKKSWWAKIKSWFR